MLLTLMKSSGSHPGYVARAAHLLPWLLHSIPGDAREESERRGRHNHPYPHCRPFVFMTGGANAESQGGSAEVYWRGACGGSPRHAQ